LEYLSDIYITIVSLSTGLFNLHTENDNIVVAVLFIQQKTDELSIEEKRNFLTKINFYENNYLGTVKDPSKHIGELINTITISDKYPDIVPYRLVQKYISTTMNVFIMLSNYGCTVFQLSRDSAKIRFEELTQEEISRCLPEFTDLFVRGRAALALDIFRNKEKVNILSHFFEKTFSVNFRG